jgi:hypothetical protein
MAASDRPATLVQGWQGAWGINVRRVLVAVRDEGPLTLVEVTRVLRWTALHADLTSGHTLGPDYGATMLTKAILEDAAEVVVVDDEGRYSVPAEMTMFRSPFTGQDLRLLTAAEQAAAKVKADAERPVRRWAARDVYSPSGKDRWTNGRLPGRKHTPDEVVDQAREIESLGWLPGARIVKDQRGVTIDGHLRHEALELLGIDPDTGVDERSGEPYVEIRAFNNDAARLHYALTANWSTLKAPTKNAIAHQVLGDVPLTLETVATLIRPLADLMAAGRVEPLAPAPAPVVSVGKPLKITAEYEELIAKIDRCGHVGATYKELEDYHGAVSARLTRLVASGHLVALAEKRLRCAVHVTPQWVDGRPTAARTEKPARAVTEVGAAPKVNAAAFTTAKVAAMTWEEAAPKSFCHAGGGRIYAGTGARVTAPVTEHLDGLINNLKATTPWLLPMICERLAQRDVAL